MRICGWSHGPATGGVDVGVARGEQLVRRGVGRAGQGPGERGAPGGGGSGDVVRIHDVQHAFKGAQDCMAARQVHGQLMHESAEGPDVLMQLPDGFVELGDGNPAQPVAWFFSRRGLVAQWGRCEGPALAQVRIGRGLHVEVHGHAAAQQFQGNVLVAR